MNGKGVEMKKKRLRDKHDDVNCFYCDHCWLIGEMLECMRIKLCELLYFRWGMISHVCIDCEHHDEDMQLFDIHRKWCRYKADEKWFRLMI